MQLARMVHTIFEAPHKHEKKHKIRLRGAQNRLSLGPLLDCPPHPDNSSYNQQIQTNQTQMDDNEHDNNKIGASDARTDGDVMHRAIRAATTYPKTIMLDPTVEPVETCTYMCDTDDDGESTGCDFSQCRKTVSGSAALWRAGIKPLVSRVLSDLDTHQNNHMVSFFDGVDIVTPYGTALLMHRASSRPPCGRIASINLWALSDD